jgi:superfamily II DNA or RNA helicase
MGSEAILRLGKSACVVVHEDYLADQWRDAFTMIAPEIRLGYLKKDRADSGEDFDVVIASTQSLVSKKREYSGEFFRSFGTVMFDEVHMYGAAEWHKVLMKFPAVYRIGLTATPDRSDGLWGLVTAHIGEIVARLDTANIKTTVHIVKMDTEIDRSDLEATWLTDTMKRARIISKIALHKGRNKWMSKQLFNAWEAGRKMLVISDRKDQLKALTTLLMGMGVPRKAIGMFVGGMKNEEERNKQASCPLVFATYTKASTGLDIVDLDGLMYGTPRAKIKQVVGRTMRELFGKKEPVIVDPWDHLIPELEGVIYSRKKQYRDMGCTIVSGED